MNDDRRRVLEMLSEGKISQEDANRLLEALGEPEGEDFEAQTERALDEAQIEAEEERGAAELEREVHESARRLTEEALGAAKEALNGARRYLGEAIPTLTLHPEGGWDAQIPEPPEPPEPPEVSGDWTDGEGQESYTESREGEPLESLEINWVAGPVELRSYDGQEVRLTEFSKRPLSEDERLWCEFSDGEMRVNWSCGGKSPGWGRWLGVRPLSKRLLVELPNGLQTLEQLKIKTASGPVNIRELNCFLEDAAVTTASGAIALSGLRGETLKATAASGGVSAENVRGEDVTLGSVSGGLRAENVSGETVRLSTVSGKLAAFDVTASDDLTASTTSGTMEFAGFTGEEVKLSSTSGDIRATGSASDAIQAGAASGSVELHLLDWPDLVKVNTSSGSVRLILLDAPDNAGFRVKYGTSSGSFQSDFPLTGKMGKKSGDADYKDGETEIQIHTSSGSIRLQKA